MKQLALVFVGALLLCAPATQAAAPVLPPGIPYQGVLLDSAGMPQTGAVDLTLRIYDALLGGTLVYKEVFLGTPLVDGVFTIELGPSGSTTDTPADPLTTSLEDALTADVGASGGGRYIEVQVGSATPQKRNPVLTVPYALRSRSSESADTAAVAITALDAQSIGGVDPVAVQAMYTQWNFDGGPPATDPSEGTADVDGDGIPNFADSDNDGDGLTDASEVSAGTGINLVTPRIFSVVPNLVSVFSPTPITVNGANFQPGLSAVLGTETLVPTNIQPGSFEAAVPPLPAGGTVDLTVTLLNGESALKTNAVTYDVLSPAPLPVNISSNTPLQVAFDGSDLGLLSIHPRYIQDTIDDGVVGWVGTGIAPAGSSLRVATLDGSDRIVVMNCQGGSCPLKLMVDADGDGVVGDLEIPVETFGGTGAYIRSPSFTYDGAGRALLGYVKRNLQGLSDVVVAHDRDGSESFEPAEIVTLETIGNASFNLGRVAFDSTDRAVYTWVDTTTGAIRLAFDLNGDGDFDDTVGGTPEKQTIDTLTDPVQCLAAAFDDSDQLAIVYSSRSPGADPIRVAWDGNGDGDFADAGETQQITGSDLAPGCDVQSQPGGGIAVAHTGNGVRLVADLNGDRDFADPGEDTHLANISASTSPIVMDRLATGNTIIVTPEGFVIDPILP